MIPPDSVAATRAKRILLVEDHKDALSILILMLQSFGYETIEAMAGADAVEKAFSNDLNLIVMDKSLPDMTGIDAAKAIKGNQSKHLTLAYHAYSAWSTRTWMDQAANAGIAAYLIKPVSMAIMKETIEKFIVP